MLIPLQAVRLVADEEPLKILCYEGLTLWILVSPCKVTYFTIPIRNTGQDIILGRLPLWNTIGYSDLIS